MGTPLTRKRYKCIWTTKRLPTFSSLPEETELLDGSAKPTEGRGRIVYETTNVYRVI